MDSDRPNADGSLNEQGSRATALLRGKVVDRVFRHSNGEVGLEFTDGTRLFADAQGGVLEVSITGGAES